MDFEGLKVIWDEQNNEPLYAVDEVGLYAILQGKSREFRRSVLLRDVREIGIGLFACLVFLLLAGLLAFGGTDWLAEKLDQVIVATLWDKIALAVAAGLWVHYSIYIYVSRKRQERRERQFDESLRGWVDREVAQTEFQVRLAKTILWWGLLPIWIAVILFTLVAFRLTGILGWILPLATYVMLAAAFVYDIHCKQWPIKNELLPRMRELESLRDMLAESER